MLLDLAFEQSVDFYSLSIVSQKEFTVYQVLVKKHTKNVR